MPVSAVMFPGEKSKYSGQTCAESHFFKEKSSQVIQKSSHDLTFFKIPKKSKSWLWLFWKKQKSQSNDFDFFQNPKKVKVMTLTFFKFPKKSKSWLWLDFYYDFFNFFYILWCPKQLTLVSWILIRFFWNFVCLRNF